MYDVYERPINHLYPNKDWGLQFPWHEVQNFLFLISASFLLLFTLFLGSIWLNLMVFFYSFGFFNIIQYVYTINTTQQQQSFIILFENTAFGYVFSSILHCHFLREKSHRAEYRRGGLWQVITLLGLSGLQQIFIAPSGSLVIKIRSILVKVVEDSSGSENRTILLQIRHNNNNNTNTHKISTTTFQVSKLGYR